jgi:hypothetical protein
MFLKNLLGVEPLFEEDEFAEWTVADYPNNPSIKIVGWPMEYLEQALSPYAETEKKDKIIFPHRLAPEKQLEIFKDLANEMPEYEWFVAQEQKLSKEEYHQHLAESKIAFSANLQETLGISMYEAALVGTFPLVPDRLSYTEMWPNSYPSIWTKDWDSYLENKDKLISKIKELMTTNKDIVKHSKEIASEVGTKFFNGNALYKAILDSKI